MHFSISSDLISDFLTGLFAVFALVTVGGVLNLLLRNIARRFPFSRLALVLALAPVSLMKFVDEAASLALFLYAMIVILLGITIDGLAYLLGPRTAREQEKVPRPKTEASPEEQKPVMVWEKAE